LPVSFSFIKKKVQKNPAKLAAIFDYIKMEKPILIAWIAARKSKYTYRYKTP
jgi:hypothetical protein